MRIKLIKVGKLTLPVREMVDTYCKRLQSFTKLEIQYTKNLDQAEKLLAEQAAKGSTCIVLLDERGKQFSSTNLAEFLKQKTEATAVKSLIFVVGGPYGLSDRLRQNADVIWSLSSAVFPSDLAWLLLCEQLYRAYNILHGTPYHHE